MSILTIFGDHEPNVIQQLENCVAAEDGARGVLCADGHLGYSQPIGGAVAYRDHVSVSGVGYDIGCVAAGSRILTADGYTKPIESLGREDRVVRPDGGGVLAPALEYGGRLEKGCQPVVEVVVGESALRLTEDHRLRTRRGWVEAGSLREDDEVLTPVFSGLPYEPCDYPAAFLRLAGYINGDGSIGKDGKRAAVTTSALEDVPGLVRDFRTLGYEPGVHMRDRPNGSFEAAVYKGSRELVSRLVEFGCPVGKKEGNWPPRLAENLLALPAWGRAQYLSAFASAEGTTPRATNEGIGSLAIKQNGDDALEVVIVLFESLGFALGKYPRQGVVQIVGGVEEQLRFFSEVGFIHTSRKRAAAARIVEIARGRGSIRQRRRMARERMLSLRSDGRKVHGIFRQAAEEFDISRVAARHLYYRRGDPRVPRGWHDAPAPFGECVWTRVKTVSSAGYAEVYDVVTGDPAQAFVAEGMTVHNCGNKAVLTNLTADELGDDVPSLMDEIFDRISFGMGRKNNEPVDHPVLDHIREAPFVPQRELLDLAAQQLGTVGAGNHYVDLFRDEQARVWVGVHFGSRGFGHKTASGFLALAKGIPFDGRAPEGEMMSPPVVLPTDSELGQAYVDAMTLAGEYAYAGRDVVVAKVLEILAAEAVEEIHNHHNYAWREEHDGETFWVVRKGCTPAFPSQKGFVGSTMGEDSVILEGTEQGESAFFSTIHGAGRAMSRTQAAGKQQTMAVCSDRNCNYRVPWKQYRAKTSGLRPDEIVFCAQHPRNRALKRRVRTRSGAIDWEAVKIDLNLKRIQLRGGAADEAPGAYKRLDDVLGAQGETVRVLHRLTPIGVAMASADTVDPFKD